MNIDTLVHLVGLAVTVGTATWVLKGELAGIRQAIAVHVAHDEEIHKSQESRIVHLEEARRARR